MSHKLNGGQTVLTARSTPVRYVAFNLTMPEESNDPNPWMDDIRRRFPDWQTERALERWPEVKRHLKIGKQVSGEVIAHAPFGLWLDIDRSWPALILIHNLTTAQDSPIGFDDFPGIGTVVHGRINALGEHGELGLTQLGSDEKTRSAT